MIVTTSTTTTSLIVDLGDRSYPIFIGAGLLSKPEHLCPFISGSQVMIVSNETIAPLYLSNVCNLLSGYQVDTVILPDGEKFKTLNTLNRIFDELLNKQHNRTTTLIALGGGVIGDMTGFAAACYQRGVNFIQIPTTLLAQVDSSVGGKTAVNHPKGKNMIGAFYQPQGVIADTDTLKTLPDREYRAGLAEVVKYGLIRDIEFFVWLENNMDSLLARDSEAIATAVYRSCENKAKVVHADEKEGGVRAILNFGHTFGHAIETAQGYGEWLHGEAIAAGMVMATELSRIMGWVTDKDKSRVVNLLANCQLPVWAPKGIDRETFMSLMSVDKKVLDGTLRLVLLESLGNAIVTSDFNADYLRSLLSAEE